MQPTTPLQKDLAETWAQNGYSQEIIDAAIALMNNPNPESSREKDEWLKIPDLKFLECVYRFTNPGHRSTLDSKNRKEEVLMDITRGITFAMFEQDGFLHWER